MDRTRLTWSGLLTGLLGLTAAIAMLGFAGEADAAKTRKCGILPGDGAYSYVKTWNVSCRSAEKVGRKAGRKFCRKPGKCVYEKLIEGRVDRGRVKARGWRCNVKVGWESYRAKCKRGKKRFVQKAGS